MQGLPGHAEDGSNLAPGEAGRPAGQYCLVIAAPGAVEIVADGDECALTRSRPYVVEHGVGHVTDRWFVRIGRTRLELALELLL
jgi:hypothetical protein